MFWWKNGNEWQVKGKRSLVHVTEMDEQKKVSAFVIVKCRIYEENVMSDDIW